MKPKYRNRKDDKNAYQNIFSFRIPSPKPIEGFGKEKYEKNKPELIKYDPIYFIDKLMTNLVFGLIQNI